MSAESTRIGASDATPASANNGMVVRRTVFKRRSPRRDPRRARRRPQTGRACEAKCVARVDVCGRFSLEIGPISITMSGPDLASLVFLANLASMSQTTLSRPSRSAHAQNTQISLKAADLTSLPYPCDSHSMARFLARRLVYDHCNAGSSQRMSLLRAERDGRTRRASKQPLMRRIRRACADLASIRIPASAFCSRCPAASRAAS